MKKVMKIVLIVVGLAVFIAVLAFGIYWYRNIHWYDKYENALKKVKAEEKQVILPSGNIINYGEVANDKPALLLIHGQMSIWEDYALVLPKLSEDWHIYAVDVYGHGESTHDESLYYIDKNGDDLIWFINHVIGEPTVVAGHSNGALTAAYIAAYGGENIAGAVLEDPPVFSTQGENWEAGCNAARRNHRCNEHYSVFWTVYRSGARIYYCGIAESDSGTVFIDFYFHFAAD